MIDTETFYKGDNYLVVDFETTNIDHGDATNDDNQLLLACWYYKNQHYYCAGDEYHQHKLLQHVQAADFIVAHNSSFELSWLHRCGADLHSILVWDTMIAEKVVAGNRKWPLSLNACLARHNLGAKAGLVDGLIHSGVCPSSIPSSFLRHYCCIDVQKTLELFEEQRAHMSEPLKRVLFTRCLLTPALVDMEYNGMHLDEAAVAAEYKSEKINLAGLSDQFNTLFSGANARSPAQMATLLYDTLGFSELKSRDGSPLRTDKGGRKTDATTIANLKARTKQQKEFIGLYAALKKSDTKVGKYLEKFQECCAKDGGILHANYNQTVTDTHRLSSTGKKYKVQFQNIDRHYKKLFVPRNEGWCMASADYAQLEFRIAAQLGKDQRAIQDIVDGVDVHQFTADTLTVAGQPTDRQAAKASTFKPLYGGTKGTQAEQAYYKAFRDKYAGIAKTQRGWVATVVQDKQLTTASGLVFYWPDTKVTSSGYVVNNESIHNYPVQSLATAEVVPIGVAHLWRKMRHMRSFLVNTVHDSIVAEVHPEEVEQWKRLVKEALLDDVTQYLEAVYGIKLIVPLDIEITISDCWKG